MGRRRGKRGRERSAEKLGFRVSELNNENNFEKNNLASGLFGKFSGMSQVLPQFQFIVRLTFLTPSLTTYFIQKFVQILLLLLWLTLSIKVLRE